ncbi:MAG: hypothetical protein FJ086_14305 [Deltaproteobacteria bacterium]|nr:hypothetical protein [Deltaproteobacteria bacterium]
MGAADLFWRPTLAGGEALSLREAVALGIRLVADWVDLELLAAVARRFAHCSPVVPGKVSPGVDASALAALENVHLLVRKAFAELPGYCRGFDVALLPFRVNELTVHANPLKGREYLAAGLPVVSTDFPEVRELGPCRIGTDTRGYLEQVAEARAGPRGSLPERAERVRSESWEARVEEIRRAVAERTLSLRS